MFPHLYKVKCGKISHTVPFNVKCLMACSYRMKCTISHRVHAMGVHVCGACMLPQCMDLSSFQKPHNLLPLRTRVSYRGGVGEVGPGISPPPLPLPQLQFSLPRNFEVEYGYYISYYVSSKCLEILSQIVSEAI